MTKFSIVIPVYNVEKYLDECVQSVVGQTYRDFEIILVDDGSGDSSGKRCDEWARQDGRIRVIHQENQGLSGARNTGIGASTGEYLLFLDSDDWWRSVAVLEAIAQRLEKTRADVLSFSYQKIYESKREDSYFGNLADAPADLTATDSLAYMAEKGIWITGACNKAIRRDLTLTHDLMFRMGIISEDIDWTLRLALCARRFDFINEVVFMYRQRTDSISHSVSPGRVEGLCANVEECLQLLTAADSEKALLLRPFVAYQYATVVHNYAGLARQDRTPEITAWVKRMLYLLQWSENSKVKLIRLCTKVFGFSMMVQLLRCREILMTIRSGGTTK